MQRPRILFYFLLFLTLAVAILLIAGAPVLTQTLDKNESIPYGTLITWIGMTSLPLTIYWGIKELRSPTKSFHKILATILKIIILFGVFWAPISYLLAGNFSFSFSEKETFQGGQMAMRLFWRLSFGIGIGSALTLVMYWISSILNRK